MADKSDVEIAIVGILNNAFGITNPNPAVLANTTVGGSTFPLRIYRGFPATERLQAEVGRGSGGACNISVYCPPISRNKNRFQQELVTVSKAPITVSVTVSGASVTVAGTGAASNDIGIGYGLQGWSYRPSDGQSADSIAVAMAALIPGATASEGVITLSTTLPVFAAVVSDTTSALEVNRIEQRFQLSVWAPTPQIRDLVGSTIIQTFAAMDFIPLADGTATERPKYVGSPERPEVETVGVFRRDELMDIEFSVFKFQTDPGVLFVGIRINTSIDLGKFNPSEL